MGMLTLAQQVHEAGALWSAVNLVANVFIVLGYVLVPFTVLRYLPLTNSVRGAGAIFFTTCVLTHLGMAFHFEHEKWMVINHAVQAVSVVWFVLGFYFLLRDALRRAEMRRRNHG